MTKPLLAPLPTSAHPQKGEKEAPMQIPSTIQVQITRIDSPAGYSWVAESKNPPAHAEGDSVPEALALLGEQIEEIWDGGPDVDRDILDRLQEEGEQARDFSEVKAELGLE